MGRPSVKEQRTEEILDAVRACVLEDGLPDTTMARIAERAGMQPSAINHFVGTRDEVIEATLARSTEYYEQLIDELTGQPVATILDLLMGDGPGARTVRPDAMVLFDEMLTLAPRQPEVRSRVEHAMEMLRELFARALADEHPDAPAADRRVVALALTLLVDNVERHVVVATLPSTARADARRAADALVATLDR